MEFILISLVVATLYAGLVAVDFVHYQKMGVGFSNNKDYQIKLWGQNAMNNSYNKGKTFWALKSSEPIFTTEKLSFPFLLPLLLTLVLSGCFGSSEFNSMPIIEHHDGVGATLEWKVVPNPAMQGTATASISPDIGEVANSGSVDVFPTETTEYTLHIKMVTDGGLILNTNIKETVYIGATIDSLEFKDTNLAQCIADQGPLFLQQFEFINCVGRNISDISELSLFSNLKVLNIDQNSISDLSPLSDLKELNTLNIGGNEIEDLSPLSTIQSLRNLNLGNNAITDLTPLSSIENLFSLGIYNNQIEDLSPLNGLANLQALVANRNSINDVSLLSNLPKLKTLNLADNQIVDVAPISQFTGLLALNLANNQIETGVVSLANLTQATLLTMDGNPSVNCLDYIQLLVDIPLTFTSCQLTLPSGQQLQFDESDLAYILSLIEDGIL